MTDTKQKTCDDAINRQWLMECVNEGWIKFDTEKDKNRYEGHIDNMTGDVKTFYDGEYEVKAKIITRGNCMLCGKRLSEGEGIFFCKECEDKVRRKVMR